MVGGAGPEDVHGGASGSLGDRRGAGAPDEHVQVLPLGCHGHGLRLRRVPAGALLLVPRRRCSSSSLGTGADDVEEVGVVEAGAARGGVARRLQRVDLDAGEVGDPGLHGLRVGVGVRARGLGA